MSTILLSYRREDTDLMVGRICDRLRGHYGVDQVLMDIDSIPYGLDFRKHIREGLERCDVVLAVIGPDWAAVNEDGRLRLADETDWVRIEIEGALARDIPVIPVLINGARMPKPEQLPDQLRDFAFRQATEIDMRRDFHAHMDRLIRVMDKHLAKPDSEDASAEPERVETVSARREEAQSEARTTEAKAAGTASAPETEGVAAGQAPEEGAEGGRYARAVAFIFFLAVFPAQFGLILYWAEELGWNWVGSGWNNPGDVVTGALVSLALALAVAGILMRRRRGKLSTTEIVLYLLGCLVALILPFLVVTGAIK